MELSYGLVWTALTNNLLCHLNIFLKIISSFISWTIPLKKAVLQSQISQQPPNWVTIKMPPFLPGLIYSSTFPLSHYSWSCMAQLHQLLHGRWNESTSPVRCFRREANCQFCWQIKWERSDSIKESRWQIFNLPNSAQQIMCSLVKCAFKTTQKVLLKHLDWITGVWSSP